MSECMKCKAPMVSLNASGLCHKCRTVKCAHPDCKETLVRRGLNHGVSYCKRHLRGKPSKTKLYIEGAM